MSSKQISLAEPARLRFHLWGYDAGIADQSASLLQEYTTVLPSVPQTYSLLYQEAFAEKIDPRSSGPLAFYLTLQGDVNNDGVVGPGDLAQDYAAMEPKSQPTMDALSGDFWIKVCDPSYPARPF